MILVAAQASMFCISWGVCGLSLAEISVFLPTCCQFEQKNQTTRIMKSRQMHANRLNLLRGISTRDLEMEEQIKMFEGAEMDI